MFFLVTFGKLPIAIVTVELGGDNFVTTNNGLLICYPMDRLHAPASCFLYLLGGSVTVVRISSRST